MRVLDRLISFIFSIIILVLSIILILVGVGAVNSQMIIDLIEKYVFVKEEIVTTPWNFLTITGIILFLASLKTTVFLSLFKNKDKEPIFVKTENGEVEIAQETITNVVRSVGSTFEGIKDVQAKMIKKNKGIEIYAVLLVYANNNIKEITEEMQKQVKQVMKETTGVNVLSVNIKVKNIYQKVKKNDSNNIVVNKTEVKEEIRENLVNAPEEAEEKIIESKEEIIENISEAEVIENSAEIEEVKNTENK